MSISILDMPYEILEKIFMMVESDPTLNTYFYINKNGKIRPANYYLITHTNTLYKHNSYNSYCINDFL